MEYEEVTKKLGTFGKYQKRLLVIVFLPVIYNSFGAPATIFLMGDQLHRCKIPSLENDTYNIVSQYQEDLINHTIPKNADGSYKQCYILVNGTEESCSEWVYDKSVFTLTVYSQFDMVCERKSGNPHVVSAFFFGTIAGGLIVCPLADIIGRRLVVCLMLTLQCIVNFSMPFSPSIHVFAVLRFFDGLAGLSFYQSAFIIGMELVGPAERLISGTIILLVFTAGEFILLGLAYMIRDWRWLQLTLASPMAIPLVFWWPRLLPESPRWLFSRGHTEGAMKILHRAAKVNKVTLPKISALAEIDDKGICFILRELMNSKKLLIRWFIMVINWFVISFIYYGLLVNIGQLGGNLYINFLISVVVESIAYLACFLLDLVGRKKMNVTLLYGAGLSCLACILPILYGTASINWLIIMFSMAGKLCISAAFGVIFIYTGELFPTVVRSVVLGMSSTSARIGSTLAPHMYYIAPGDIGKVIPLIIYGVTTIISASLSIMLPETRRKKLLEKVKDVENETTVEQNYGTVGVTESREDIDELCKLHSSDTKI